MFKYLVYCTESSIEGRTFVYMVTFLSKSKHLISSITLPKYFCFPLWASRTNLVQCLVGVCMCLCQVRIFLWDRVMDSSFIHVCVCIENDWWCDNVKRYIKYNKIKRNKINVSRLCLHLRFDCFPPPFNSLCSASTFIPTHKHTCTHPLNSRASHQIHARAEALSPFKSVCIPLDNTGMRIRESTPFKINCVVCLYIAALAMLV